MILESIPATPPPDGPTGDDVTEDTLLGGRVRLLQPAQGYRAAIDPVLLAAATPAAGADRVVDLGCGAGAAAFCLTARLDGVRVAGLEVQAAAADLARRNAELNGVASRVRITLGDTAQAPAHLPAGSDPDLVSGRFDHVMTNPPFYPGARHTRSPRVGKAASHGEGTADLATWIAAAARLLAPRGTLTMIHRADRVDEILARLAGRFGAVVLYPLWPRAGVEAKRVIIRARLGARSPARLLPGLVLHGEGGGYTPAAEAVLRDGAGLDFQ
ncbi:tRNA1(Val) (adenine(37)-N6)-methyltransferase [Azospirillum sp. B4]|uniref:tRNA1(Val) (adenine(37)-N6)-methyltransferase n=1 Tax=Azospirillum sp. B4 TaxID=95605 RepID=UPI00034C58EB|nr:methyltransferase [Azospirillum sp. B4]